MKKLLALIMVTAAMAVGTGAYADAEITVKVNDKVLTFDSQPYIKNDITMVPLRGIFEELEANVTWDQETLTVVGIRNTDVVVLQIGNEGAFVNGEKKILEQPAEVVDDRTMIPARFISESLGAEVEWDQENLTVNIKY